MLLMLTSALLLKKTSRQIHRSVQIGVLAIVVKRNIYVFICFRINGETPMKQLQEWVPEGEDESHELEEGGGGLGGNGNGWSPHEMFAKNAEFGVETTFDPNLSGYTVQLSNKGADTADWREKVKNYTDVVGTAT